MSHGESPDYRQLGIRIYPEPPWVARDFGGHGTPGYGNHLLQHSASAESGMGTFKKLNVTRHAFKVHMTAADTQALKRNI